MTAIKKKKYVCYGLAKMHSIFYGVLESKLNKTFFSSNSETSPFSLHLLSSII